MYIYIYIYLFMYIFVSYSNQTLFYQPFFSITFPLNEGRHREALNMQIDWNTFTSLHIWLQFVTGPTATFEASKGICADLVASRSTFLALIDVLIWEHKKKKSWEQNIGSWIIFLLYESMQIFTTTPETVIRELSSFNFSCAENDRKVLT